MKDTLLDNICPDAGDIKSGIGFFSEGGRFFVPYVESLPIEAWPVDANEPRADMPSEDASLKVKDFTDFLSSCQRLYLQFSTGDDLFAMVEKSILYLAGIGFVPADWKNFDQLFDISTLQHYQIDFEKRDYQIRIANENDVTALLTVEEACWSEALRVTQAALAERIRTYANGQLVVIKDSQVVGALYAQRIDSAELLPGSTIHNVAKLHSDLGKVLQFLSVNVLPESSLSGVGYEFFEFALALAKVRGFKRVVAVSLCQSFNGESFEALENYLHHKDENGIHRDPILKFHGLHGARIEGLVEGFRPEDSDNLGCGVLVSYDFHQSQLSAKDALAEKPVSTGKVFDIRPLLNNSSITSELDETAMATRFSDLGLESMDILSLSAQISSDYPIAVTPLDFFKHPTPRLLERFIRERTSAIAHADQPLKTAHSDQTDRENAEAKNPANTQEVSTLAIIGMAARLPGADNLDAFQHLLKTNTDAVGCLGDLGEEAQLRQLPANTRGGFVRSVAEFDARFFGVSPREARSLDPQQRILLETTWKALEHAGIAAADIPQMRMGIYIGAFNHDYQFLQVRQNNGQDTSPYFWSGNSTSMLAGRLAYFLGAQGPAVVVDTACSASLVALHQAAAAIRNGDCDVAVVAGVNLILSDEVHRSFEQAGMLSQDGKCKSFDARADGYVRSEGCCAIILRATDQAVKARDHIYAELLATAINQDGASNGLTAPSATAQAELIRRALDVANIAPEAVDYIEAHGTGTPLGDPIEFEALQSVFGNSDHNRQSPLLIGSVKSNIGHAEAAAGLAGLIKVVLSMAAEEIPGNLHFNQANALIDLASIPAKIAVGSEPWKKTRERSRIAGISSFGFSGTNAHALVAEASHANVEREPEASTQPQVIALSADNETALAARIAQLREHLCQQHSPSLEDIAFTLTAGRSHRSKRVAAVCTSVDESIALLEKWQGNVSGELVELSSIYETAFTFTGQGSQYAGMGQELYDTEPLVRYWFDRADKYSSELLPESLVTIMREGHCGDYELSHTLFTQPAIFTLQVALVELLKSWGIKPAAVLGHSLGEYAAAYAAGVFSFDDALRLVLRRAMLMQGLPSGAMTSVFAARETVAPMLKLACVNLSVAVINTPDTVVLSGPEDEIENFEAYLDQHDIFYARLQVSHANHSFMLDPILSDYEAELKTVSFNLPKILFYSSMTGKTETERLLDPQYWVEQLRNTVHYHEAAVSLASNHAHRLEIGSMPILTRIGEGAIEGGHWDTLCGQGGLSDESVRQYLAKAYVHGANIQWQQLYANTTAVKVALPSYPFTHKTYWLDDAHYLARAPHTPHSNQFDNTNEAVSMNDRTEQPPSSRIMRDYYADLRDRVSDSGASTDVKAVSGRIRFAPFDQVLSGFTWLPTFLGTPMSEPHQTAIQTAHDQMLDVMFRSLDLQTIHSAVDVGCGYGTDVLELAARYPHMHITGHNISNEQIEFARERAVNMGLQNQVNFSLTNSCTGEFAKTYDLAWSFQVVHHQQDKLPLFKNVSRSLVNGGYFVLAEILSAEPDAIDHPESSAYFTPAEEWADQLSVAGFRVEQAVDASAEIANYLTDPNFEQNLVELAGGSGQNTLKHLRGPHDLGRLLSKGFTKYMLLAVRKDAMANKEILKRDNTIRLTNPLPYRQAALSLTGIDSHEKVNSVPSQINASNQVPQAVSESVSTAVDDPLRQMVAKILEIEVDELDPIVPLVRQGLNSLMAMEIRRELKKVAGADIPVTTLLGEASLKDIQAQVGDLTPPRQPVNSAAPANTTDPVESLSEPEVDALILRLLESTNSKVV